MEQFVTASYRDARDADYAIGQVLNQGYSRTGTSAIMTDRSRRTFLRDANISPLAAIMTAPDCTSKTMSIDDTDDVGTPISMGGPLSREVERGARNSKRLVELIESLGADRRVAETAARDVSRGGVFIAMAVPEQDFATVRQLMNKRGKIATEASTR